MSWRSEEVMDIMDWLDGYVTRRYGNWTQESHDAWELLLQGPIASTGVGTFGPSLHAHLASL